MNAYELGRCLGDITPHAFKTFYLRQHLDSLDHQEDIKFDGRTTPDPTVPATAHKAGTNCLATDQTGRCLVSGGAETSIKLWDLENKHTEPANTIGVQRSTSFETIHAPKASISKATPNAHSHSITSLSIYPFDPDPTTLLTTSYDQSLLLTQITPTSLQPVHKFPLDFTVYTHATNPLPSSSALIAVGTSHPAPRLIDLRTALATHTLPGHSGAIYSLAWHPKREHILFSSSADGRILVFDIRRATPAFASFDSDDSLGVPHRPALDFAARAHAGLITGITLSSDGSKLISAGHDQRIRVWDVATGRNDLVHFGPRIRNSREGELNPVLVPRRATVGSGPEVLLWPNDDGKGEILMHEIREGRLLRVLQTKNLVKVEKKGVGGKSVAKLTSGGRINSLVFRGIENRDGLGGALEMFSAHGDGRICAWSTPDGDDGEESEEEIERDLTAEETHAEKSRKRKRDLIEGLVQGLTKRPVTFS